MRRPGRRSPFSTNELFRLLCFEYKVVSVEHFLDEMDRDECIWILKNLAYTDRNLWEATRMKVFSTASMFSKQRVKMTDIIKFPWEDDIKEVEELEIPAMSEEERKRMEEYVIGVLNERDKNK